MMQENPYQNPLEDVKKKVSEAAEGDKRWGLICYVPILNIITCSITAVFKVKSEYALFHSRQGLVLFGSWFLTIVVAFFSPVLSLMMWGAVLLLHAYGIVIAFSGKMTKIPGIGNLAMKIPDTYIFTLLTQKTLDQPEISEGKTEGVDEASEVSDGVSETSEKTYEGADEASEEVDNTSESSDNSQQQ